MNNIQLGKVKRLLSLAGLSAKFIPQLVGVKVVDVKKIKQEMQDGK